MALLTQYDHVPYDHNMNTPTQPPTDAELEALAAFELMIKEQGELDARYVHTSGCLDSLLAAQPEW